jgi:hypothetical protein
MGIYTGDGTRVTKAAFPTSAVDDPERVVTADLFATRPFDQGTRPSDSRDNVPEGSIRTLLCKAGTVMRQSEIDKLFPAATIDTITPASGPAAGGTVVTITGANLDGVSSVSFGGTAGTALTVMSSGKLQVTAPAHAAGAVNVVVSDEAGPVTETGGYTYV